MFRAIPLTTWSKSVDAALDRRRPWWTTYDELLDLDSVGSVIVSGWIMSA